MQTVRVGYIPEHFSSPIIFAQQKGYFSACGIIADLIPFPSGSGHLIQALTEGEIELAIGLTEAFVRGIADTDIGSVPQYQIVGTYVKSPLNWAISVGAENTQFKSADELDGASIGVSRIGSGSYVMSFVLALQQKFEKPFAEHVVCDTFAKLREAVNNDKADAFLWEYFTTKKYYDEGEIKMVGNIYTPWPSWVIVKRTDVANEVVSKFCRAVTDGIVYFQGHKKEAVELITSNFDYSAEDAENWLPTVEFHVPCHQLSDRTKVVDETLRVLQSASVLKHKDNQEIICKNLEAGLCSLDS